MFESAPQSSDYQISEFETLTFSHRLIISHIEPQSALEELIPKAQIAKLKTAKTGRFFVTQIEFESRGTQTATKIAKRLAELKGLKVMGLEHTLKASKIKV